MKSAEVYKAIREVMVLWCEQNGFKRTSGGMPGWFKPVNDDFIVFWFQCSQDGWDVYAGSSFCVEFQFSSSPQIGGGSSEQRHRLSFFLTSEELEAARQKQNRVIAKLVYPPAECFVQLSGSTASWYRQKFAPIDKPYPSQHDVWLRYMDKVDVVVWAEFVRERLPAILTKLI